jgi:hypothetical protein
VYVRSVYKEYLIEGVVVPVFLKSGAVGAGVVYF